LKEIYKKIREVISDSKRRPDYHILFDKRISHYELKILEERGYIVDDVHMAGRKETKISWECS
jgi:predicted house-cleaning noncanonical NTP pyrophosphatase (MazG superfamily)